jgi:peptidoglycan-N-acetylglucosamine deacetylase
VPASAPFASTAYRWPNKLIVAVATKLAGSALLFAGHIPAGLLLFFTPDPWLFWNLFRPTATGLGPLIRRFKTGKREVWLTIDDGPDPATTPRTLNALAHHGARATFFLIGEKAARHPGLVAEIARQGHTIANHTYSHQPARFWALTGRQLGREIDRCTAAIRAAGVEPAPWFRGPVGLKNIFLFRELARRGLGLVHWNTRGYDTRPRPPDKIIDDITRDLQPGAIILFHEHAPSLGKEPTLIERLLARIDRGQFSCTIPSAESLSA